MSKFALKEFATGGLICFSAVPVDWVGISVVRADWLCADWETLLADKLVLDAGVDALLTESD